MEMYEKKCARCGFIAHSKALAKRKFPPNKRVSDGLHSWCQKCVLANRAWISKTNPDSFAYIRLMFEEMKFSYPYEVEVCHGYVMEKLEAEYGVVLEKEKV